MRQIGTLPDQDQAEAFSDYLITLGVENMAEETPGGWIIWVERDDHLDRARQELEQFRASPADSKYRMASRKAEQIRKDQEKQTQRRQRNYYDVRTRWSDTRQWAAPLTLALIIASVVVAVLTHLGNGHEAGGSAARVQNALQFASIEVEGQYVLYRRYLLDIREGQVWRLVTPIFLHFGFLHIIFNMLWLRDLGGQIESRRGTLRLAGVVLAGAILGNLAQYTHSGPLFGGMSGVVYALFGYVWIKGRYRPDLGMGVDNNTLIIMLGWLVLGFSGVLGDRIGNLAHLAGLAAGVAIAITPIAWQRLRRR